MTVKLPDEQWSKMLGFLRMCPDIYIGQLRPPTFCRRRALDHAQRGAVALAASRVWQVEQRNKRFARWCDKGIWERRNDPEARVIIEQNLGIMLGV